MTTLTEKAARLIEEREKFQVERMVYGPSRLHNGLYYAGHVVGEDPHPNFQITKRGEFFSDHEAYFHVLSANHSAQIARAFIIAVEALEQISRKVPHKVSREEAADMACEFKIGANKALQKIEALK